jgi:hypothetical protein
MSPKEISSEAKSHREAAANHLRKSRNATTAAEKASEVRKARSYETMANNQDWLDNERAKVTRREAGNLE